MKIKTLLFCLLFGSSFFLNAQMTVGDMVVGQGVTNPNQWVNYNSTVNPDLRGIYVDVNTSACGFQSTPHYLVTLERGSSRWLVSGVPSVYSPTPNGFRVYLRWTDHPDDEADLVGDANPLRAATALTHGWVIRWTAIELGPCAQCTGNSRSFNPTEIEEENTAKSSFEIESAEKTKMENSNSKNIRIVPNPSDSQIEIISNKAINSFEIFDLTGKLLKTTKESIIDINDLPQGNYFIKMRVNGDIVTKQFSKI